MKSQSYLCFLTLTGIVVLLLTIGSIAAAHQLAVIIPLKGKALGQHPMGQSYTNSIEMTFNLLPAGTFTMGSPNGMGKTPAEPG